MHPLKHLKFGTCGRQENCLVLVYDQPHGFEVKIMHRQFNHNFKYEKAQLEKEKDELQLPKVSNIFADEMGRGDDGPSINRVFQKDMKIMRWRTLSERLKVIGSTNRKINITSNLVGIGPHFLLRLELENVTEEMLYDVKILVNFDASILRL